MEISIILPLSQNEDSKKIKRLINSIASQDYKNYEFLIVTNPKKALEIKSELQKLTRTAIYKKVLPKSRARNFGAKKAKGKYLLHVDADMMLEKGLLKELSKLIKRGAKASIIPCPVDTNTNFLGKVRSLEAQILSENDVLESPIFIEKKLFSKLGGYEEKLDPLDDWGLNLALKEKGIKFSRTRNKMVLSIHPSLKSSFKRMYERGKAVPLLKEKYQAAPHTSIRNKLNLYLKKRKRLLKHPLLAMCLVPLKILDYLAYYLGKTYPKNPYLLSKTADNYDKQRLTTNYVLYKHYAETKSLKNFLKNSKNILEVGCGTGRLTENLIDSGFQITATEPSDKMLKIYKKKSLPKAIKASAEDLPFKGNSFDAVFSLRVVWHHPLKKAEEMIAEMARVSSNTVIFDVVNKKRFLGKILITPNTYPVELNSFLKLCNKYKLRKDEIIPLETTIPVWLNILPKELGEKLFPYIYSIDLKLAKMIPPGRYLISFKKTNS